MFRKTLLLIALATTVLALEPTDQTAIEKIIQEQAYSWNLRQCHGFGDGYAQDAEFVNIFGMKFKGREEIEKRHIVILQSFLRDSQFHVLNTTLREVQPGVVIASVQWKVEGFRTPQMDSSQPGVIREGIFTHVFAQSDGKWEIVSSQNTLKL